MAAKHSVRRKIKVVQILETAVYLNLRRRVFKEHV
jgi:hypothetical protein